MHSEREKTTSKQSKIPGITWISHITIQIAIKIFKTFVNFKTILLQLIQETQGGDFFIEREF